MKYTILGNTDFNISKVGLGCWQLGADWGNEIPEKKAFSILNEAVNNGINFFDTADVYGNGLSETTIGKFLKTTNTPIIVATKFGRGANVFPDNYSENALRASVLNAIKRLGVVSLDLLQLHCVPLNVLKEGAIFNWLRTLKKEGLIKSFGASVESVEEGLLCLEEEGITSLQVIFNVFRQKLITTLLPEAEKKGVGIIVRLPLASGLLANKFTKETVFLENDHRNYNKDGDVFNVGETFAGLPFDKGVDLVSKIKDSYLPTHTNMVLFALRWILDHKAVTTIIPGASSVEQVKTNAAAADLEPLGIEVHEKLNKFYEQDVVQFIRGSY